MLSSLDLVGQVKPVPVSVVREIIGDVKSRDLSDTKPKFRWAVAIGVAIFFLILSIIFFFRFLLAK